MENYDMEHFICMRCGGQQAASAAPPAECAICAEERETVDPDGQQWTTLSEMRRRHYRNGFRSIDPSVLGIVTEPAFAIGQQSYLILTDRGNVLWDCISFLDDATIAVVKGLGGLAGIALSHPHLYGSMVEWGHAFDAPIYIHSADQAWVQRPDPTITFWSGAAREIVPGVTMVHCGGHFPGSCVLFWAGGADGRGAIFTGDTIMVAADRRWVSFMHSYVNFIPMNAQSVRQIVGAVTPYPFERLYGGWYGQVVSRDAKDAIDRSKERYIRHITAETARDDHV
jgi:hypothetical protein